MYTYFDMLGDMGGLQSTLYIIGQAIMSLLSFIYPHEVTRLLANKIFRVRQTTIPQTNSAQTTKESHLGLKMNELSWCANSNSNSKILISKAENKIYKELDLTSFIKL